MESRAGRELPRRLKELVSRLSRVDGLNLGVCFLAYYCVIFASLPIATAIGLATNFTDVRLRGLAVVSPVAGAYLVIGLASFVVGYYLVGKRVMNYALAEFLHQPWDPTRSLWVAGMFFIGGFALKAVRWLSTSPAERAAFESFVSSCFSLNPLHYIALAIILAQYFVILRKGEKAVQHWQLLAWSFLIFSFASGLIAGGGRFAVVVPVTIYLVTRHYLYRHCLGKILIALAIAVLVLFPIKVFLKSSPITSAPVNDRQASSASRSPSANTPFVDHDIYQYLVNSTLGRIGQSHIFTAVVERTEYFLNGWGFLDFVHAFSLWPGSYDGNHGYYRNDGNDFGRAYGILPPFDFVTGIGPTQIGDFYLNFGGLGIVLGMMFIGVMFRYLFENLVTKTSPSGIMCYAMLWLPLLHGFEDWVSLTYARLIKLFALLLLAHILLTAPAPTWRWANCPLAVSLFLRWGRTLWKGALRPFAVGFMGLVLSATVLSFVIREGHIFSSSIPFSPSLPHSLSGLVRTIEPCETRGPIAFKDALPLFSEVTDGIEPRDTFARDEGDRVFLRALDLFAVHRYDEAFRLFEEAASYGHAWAMYDMGLLSYVGLGVQRDRPLGSHWIQSAAQRGVRRAYTMLGKMHVLGPEKGRSVAEAKAFFLKGAEGGDMTAQEWLRYLGSGDLVPEGKGDRPATLALYEHGAKLGDPLAMERLGRLYESGLGVGKDLDRARYWLKEAEQLKGNPVRVVSSEIMSQYYGRYAELVSAHRERHNPLLLRALGILYAEGLAVPKDLTRARTWLEQAARLGDTLSMRILGQMFERGVEGVQDVDAAKTWYEKAAKKGDLVSMRKLGHLILVRDHDRLAAFERYLQAAKGGESTAMCEVGVLCLYDTDECRLEDAWNWLTHAARAGVAPAMVNLGVMSERGWGIPKDPSRAFAWYRKAADAGNVTAMRTLGIMYQHGIGVTTDTNLAMKWYRQAADNGDPVSTAILSNR